MAMNAINLHHHRVVHWHGTDYKQLGVLIKIPQSKLPSVDEVYWGWYYKFVVHANDMTLGFTTISNTLQ